jgi:hypothetical protein
MDSDRCYFLVKQTCYIFVVFNKVSQCYRTAPVKNSHLSPASKFTFKVLPFKVIQYDHSARRASFAGTMSGNSLNVVTEL